MSPSPRRWRRRLAVAALLSALAGVLLVNAAARPPRAYPDSPQFHDGAFHNAVTPKGPEGAGDVLKLWWKFFFGKRPTTRPDTQLPVQPLTRADLEAAPDHHLWRLGHSTVLMKLDGGFWITDPVFSERASPVQFAGPKRFHAPAIALDELPPLRGVILSHDHYDHLDRASIQALTTRAQVFLTPLGVGDTLVRWGVAPERVIQLDWWQSTQIDGLHFTATPAQHFSGRTPFRKNPTLWASWVVQTPALKLFFSGDTGYFDGFKAIGERLGPFDVTLMENGAYDPLWSGVHMLPEQSVQAHQDLRGGWMLPIHNSTFDLAFHDWQAPMETVLSLAEQRGVSLSTPRMGEPVNLLAMRTFERWWKPLVRTQERNAAAVGNTLKPSAGESAR